jgi:2-keto-4-pentenoate hydratase/2-oxohepta-3-ene-1,7-dioic acid hydratase in catechol pathway
MQLIRFSQKGMNSQWGWIYDNYVGTLTGSPFEPFQRSEANIMLEKVELLAPVKPGKVIAVGRNYPEHAQEQQAEIPDKPLIFLKPPSSVIGPGGTIYLPPQSNQVEYEAELAVVIGKKGRWIDISTIDEYILGYCIANDVTARDIQNSDDQWTRAKGFDTFCPLGPWIETTLDPSDILITSRLNDEIRQMSSTREMVFNIPQLIVYISSIMTLDPGDVILSGTPAGVGQLSSGDVISITIEGIGELINKVADDGRVSK